MTPRNISITINIAAWLVPAWFIFFHMPYAISFIAVVLVPLVAIGVALIYKNDISLVDGMDSRDKSSLLFVMIIPGLTLLLRSVYDFEVLSYRTIWISSVVVCVLLSVAISFTSVNLKTDNGRATYVSVALFMFLFSFGACKIINCTLDTSTPSYFKAFIGNRSVDRGSKSTAIPNLSLNFPGHESNPETVVIPADAYLKLQDQDSVTIEQHKGLLNATWYKVIVP